MPVYVYECEECQQQWEYLQSVNDPPMTKCEKCAGKLMKIIAPTAFVLKGGGWYKDLYSSSKGAAPSASSSSSSSSSTASKSDSGSGGGKSDSGTAGAGSGSGSSGSGDKK